MTLQQKLAENFSAPRQLTFQSGRTLLLFPAKSMFRNQRVYRETRFFFQEQAGKDRRTLSSTHAPVGNPDDVLREGGPRLSAAGNLHRRSARMWEQRKNVLIRYTFLVSFLLFSISIGVRLSRAMMLMRKFGLL
jgi:hypothetical protein